MNMLYDILIDTVMDSFRMLPFLFVAFLLIEALEHFSTAFVNQTLTKINKAGPIMGALFGCIPQCGFSVMSANLFSSGVISLGTLIAVFLSTSDEAIIILMGHPGNSAAIWRLLIVKLIIAIIAGYVADLFLAKKITHPKHIGDLCDHCGCHDHHGIIIPAWKHTMQLFVFIFLFSAALNLLVEIVGLNTIGTYLLDGTVFQPFLTALIGFIPNCAASVLLTELYLSGVISFSSVIAGLCTNAGMGLVVLFKVNKDYRENLKIVGLLYAISVIAGILLTILF